MSAPPHQTRWWRHTSPQFLIILGASCAAGWIAAAAGNATVALICIDAALAITALVVVASFARARIHRERLQQELRAELHDTLHGVITVACGAESAAERIRAVIKARYDEPGVTRTP